MRKRMGLGFYKSQHKDVLILNADQNQSPMEESLATKKESIIWP